MKVDVRVDFSKAHKLIAQLTGREFAAATAKALTDAGYEARKAIQAEMDRSFDRPTPYIRKSILVTPASPDKLQAVIEPTYMGGKGVDPKNVLQAHIFGGQRKHKASERAMRDAGILAFGHSIVPGDACPLDRYGNIPRGFMVQLISYFQAFSQQGYSANMTRKRKDKLANVGRSAGGYKTINGVQYFVSPVGMKGAHDAKNRAAHLPPGIWSRSGIHGSNVKPILMFVRQPSYQRRLDFFDKPIQAAKNKFNPRLRYHMRTILEAGR